MKHFVCMLVLFSATAVRCETVSTASQIKQVRIEATKALSKDALLHWKISNDSDLAVYVYDFYLLGPAYRVERDGSRVVFDTAPVSQEATCPPNRFPPVLLLVVGAHRSIEGDFTDPETKDLGGKQASIRIAVGAEPYTVVAQAKRFFKSQCRHNPYDAIVRWGTILESNAIQF